MRTRTLQLAAVAVALGVAAPTATAVAAPGKKPSDRPATKAPAKKPAKKRVSAPIIDCTADGDLDKVYQPGTLLKALRNLPTDIGTYTQCPDVLRFARTAGPVLPVTRRFARFKARCTGAAYEVKISVGDRTLGTATVKKCRRGSRVVKVPVGTLGTTKARKRSLATIVVNPGGDELQFVSRLVGRRRF